MTFEYDPDESVANEAKHGIDSEQARALWNDPWLLEVPARTDDEPRFLVIGRLLGRYWSAICVRRGDNLRIISVRHARKKEIEHYESD